MTEGKTMRTLLALTLAGALCVPLAATAAKTIYRDDQQPGTAEQVAKGKEAFAVCAGCHGADGDGVQGLAPKLNSANWLSAVSNDFLGKTIRRGREGSNMVPWHAGLGDEAIDDIVFFIRSWQTDKGAKLDESPLKGDVEEGKRMYFDVCATCHGVRGAGYAAGLEGIGIGRKAFLDNASDGYLRFMVRKGKDATAMESFTNNSPVVIDDLTDQQIDSVIAYLRQQAW